MSDIWELLKKMDCEDCSVHDDCDNKNLCAEWITKAKPELLKLKEKAETLDVILVGRSLDEYIALMDSFQEKAEKWDELNKHNLVLERFNMLSDLFELKKTVEQMRTTTHGTWKMAQLINKAWKILEAEG